MERRNNLDSRSKNPLVTAERLHRFKCPFCGSKDKNITAVHSIDDREGEDTYNQWVENVKIVCCNDCGYTMFFGHSALAIRSLCFDYALSMKESEEFVRNFHMENHEDPKINPHTGDSPARKND